MIFPEGEGHKDFERLSKKKRMYFFYSFTEQLEWQSQYDSFVPSSLAVALTLDENLYVSNFKGLVMDFPRVKFGGSL